MECTKHFTCYTGIQYGRLLLYLSCSSIKMASFKQSRTWTFLCSQKTSFTI